MLHSESSSSYDTDSDESSPDLSAPRKVPNLHPITVNLAPPVPQRSGATKRSTDGPQPKSKQIRTDQLPVQYLRKPISNKRNTGLVPAVAKDIVPTKAVREKSSHLIPSCSQDEETPLSYHVAHSPQQETFNATILQALAKLERRISGLLPEEQDDNESQPDDLVLSAELETDPYMPSSQASSWDTSSAFDPASLIENEYFQDTSLEVADYITKCFSNRSSEEQRKAIKQFKRPDINLMKVPRLDPFLADRFPFVLKKDNKLVEIQRHLLQSVGPLSNLANKLSKGDSIDHSTLTTHISAALTLLGSLAAFITEKRRRQGIQAFDKCLKLDLKSFPPDFDSSLLFGESQLNKLCELSKTHKRLEASNQKPRTPSTQYQRNNSSTFTNLRPRGQFFRRGPAGGAGSSRANYQYRPKYGENKFPKPTARKSPNFRSF